MKTLNEYQFQEKDIIGKFVICLMDCYDVSKMRRYIKGEKYKVTHWFDDHTFGTTHSSQCTEKKYFALCPSNIINFKLKSSYYFY